MQTRAAILWEPHRQLNLSMVGRLELAEMVTTTDTLDEINQRYQDLRDGRNIRRVVVYD